MNVVRDEVFEIVGAALLNQSVPTFTEVDWSSIYQEFSVQAIIANPANIIAKLGIPEEIEQKWTEEIMRVSASGIRLMADQNELIKLLNEHSISYAILKGTAAAVYYPIPWLRSMGDVDLIVHPDDFDRTRQLMIDHGYKLEESDNERHEGFKHHQTHYELHRYFSTEGPESELDRLILESLPSVKQCKIMDYSFNMLPEPINGIILIQHINQHLRTGLGLRQMIDWFMYVKQELPDDKWPEFKSLSDRVGLTKLAKIATRVGQLYFGLSPELQWCRDADESVCDDVIDLIFRSGNFGRKDYENIRSSYVLGKLQKNPFATLQEAGKHNWKALKKHPWLEPVAWFYQIFRYMKQGTGTIGKIGQNQRRSKDMDELMKKFA